jgi:hypothetical protein
MEIIGSKAPLSDIHHHLGASPASSSLWPQAFSDSLVKLSSTNLIFIYNFVLLFTPVYILLYFLWNFFSSFLVSYYCTGSSSWDLQKCLQYILAKFIPPSLSIISFLYILRTISTGFIFIYILLHEHTIFPLYLPSYTLFLYPLPLTGTKPQTGSVLPSSSLFLKKDIFVV